MRNLHQFQKIVLHRVENGWIVNNDSSFTDRGIWFAFESTESLAEQLVEVVGKSGWRVSVPQQPDPVLVPRKSVKMPERGAGGKFLPKERVDPLSYENKTSPRS